MKVYIEDESGYYLYEVQDKGWSDVFYLLYNEKYYRLSIRDRVRLFQDVDAEIIYVGAPIPMPNLVIVNTISYEDVRLAIKKLIESGIIDYFKACETIGDKIIRFASQKEIEQYKKIGWPYWVNKSDLKVFIDTD